MRTGYRTSTRTTLLPFLKIPMLKIHEKIATPIETSPKATTLTLPYERRVISRQRVTLDDGRDAGLFLTRGTILHDNDYLSAETGEVIIIKAAKETVSTLYCDDALMLARACYHLGNRHVPLQINANLLRYQHDHVLDDMLHGLGLHVTVEEASFEPEAGAYGGGHKHAHDDEHHHHAHEHSH